MDGETINETPRALKRRRAFKTSEKSIEFAVEYIYPDQIVRTEEVESDLQTSLPSGAQFCLSSDGLVLAQSSLGQNFPDLYELQWAPCMDAQSACQNQGNRKWRIRYVPILYAPGPEPLKRLPPGTSPCVTSIVESGDRILVYYTAIETTTGGAIPASDCDKSPAHGDFAAEFFIELAAPRSIVKAAEHWDWLRPCQVSADPPGGRKGTGQYSICDLGRDSFKIRIEPRRNTAPAVVDVSLSDPGSGTAKISLPAGRIDSAGVTDSGEILLYEKASNMAWQIGAGKTLLKSRLYERADCGSPSTP
jgi:hypothetical protein